MRRTVLLTLVLATMVPQVASSQILIWPMLGGVPTHEGNATSMPDLPLSIAWKTDLGIPSYSAPITNGDKVFVTSGRQGGDTGAMYCIDYLDGKIVWRFDSSGGFPGTPVIAAGRLIGACTDGHIYGRVLDGSNVFVTLIEGKGSKSSGVDLTNAVVFGLEGGRHNLVCVDPYTGEVKWTDSISSDVQVCPTSYGGMIFVPTQGKNLQAITYSNAENSENAKILWEKDLGSEVSGSPMVLNETVIVPTKNAVLAFKINEGESAWVFDTTGSSTMPATDGVNVFLGFEDGNLICIDGMNGQPNWSFKTGSRITCSPVVAAGKIAFGCEDGSFYIIDDKGQELFQIKLPAIPTAQPLPMWDRILVTCSNGLLICLGKPLDETPPPDEPLKPELKKATIKIDAPETAFVGQKIQIPIFIEDAEKIISTEFSVVFDESKLDYISFEDGGFFKSNGLPSHISEHKSPNEVNFNITGQNVSEGVDGKGILLILTMTPKESGLQRLTFVDAKVYHKNLTSNDPNLESDSFVVKQPEPEVEIILSPERVDLGLISKIKKTTLQLTQKNGQEAEFVLRASSEWATIYPQTGRIAGNAGIDINVTIDPENLDAGFHEIIISVNVIGRTLKNSILFVVQKDEQPIEPPTCIEIDPINLDFGYIPRGREVSIDFTINFKTDQDVSGTIQSDRKWLRVAPATFKTKGDKLSGIATIAASELPGGDFFVGHLIFKTKGNVCKEVTVEGHVATQPSIILELDVGVKKATIGSLSVDLDQSPRIRNNRTLVPIRFVSESFGCKVQWEAATKKITISRFEDTIVLWIGKKEALVNGQLVKLDVEPSIEDNGTLVPIRFVSQAFGAKVEWFHETKHIKITYTPAPEI